MPDPVTDTAATCDGYEWFPGDFASKCLLPPGHKAPDGTFLGRSCKGIPPFTWEFCRSCGGAGWVGSRFDHRHTDCGHRCILCYPPPGYDRTYAVGAPDGT